MQRAGKAGLCCPQQTVNHVVGSKCYPCPRLGPRRPRHESRLAGMDVGPTSKPPAGNDILIGVPSGGRDFMRFSRMIALAGMAIVCVQSSGAQVTVNYDWPFYRHDQAGTGYSPLAQITVQNVSGLTQA